VAAQPAQALAVARKALALADLAIFSRAAWAACSRAGAGGVISGGLNDLLRQFQQSGHGEAANSWVSQGPNKQISSGDLASALGGDQIDNLMSQSGLSRQELLDGLSRYLPDVVNHLTPDGRLPTESELAGRL
jgi:uncharacterized protein YidB (DUF937 family)